MAKNLATNYEKQFDAQFAYASLLEDKYNKKFEFVGANKIEIYSPITTKLQLTQDKGFSNILNRGNFTDSMMQKAAGAWLQEEIRNECTLTVEKYALSKWINSGNFEKIDAAPTNETIVSALKPMFYDFDKEHVPYYGRYLYIRPDVLSMIKLSDEWQGADGLPEKRVCGEFMGAKVVKVPTSYLPENCYASLISKEAVMLAKKISEFKTHIDPPGVSGWLMEGRIYYDAFVLAQKNAGVCTLVLKDKQAIVSISAAGVITAANAKKTYYTTDGSDPRYSSTRELFTGTSGTAVSASGDTIKAWAEGNGVLSSDVVIKKRTS